ncbi:VOC family protein [Nocardioides sp. InS609-2]|uniref:VOC family protein n=1 Tax=Nocardioides sp. InS609-2 TaxID=2760705 RepID=UPI0020C03F02|nr:VOC family protein [Nocardioides sp. InS609-2]
MTSPSISLRTVCLDCSDAHAMAGFYGALLGWEPTFTEPDWVLMRNPAGGVGLSFQAEPAYVAPTWPEAPGQQQKMIHLDVLVDDLEAALAVALAAGGRAAPYQPREDLRVVLDPSGHPLCLFLD